MTSNGQIWVINPDGTGRTQLTDAPLPSNNDDPVGSPDAQRIPFSINRNRSQVLCTMTADVSEQRKLASSAAGPLPADTAWQSIR
jgi:Tol biopolymer transport system component